MLMETTHWAIYQTFLDKNGSLKLYASRKPGLLVYIINYRMSVRTYVRPYVRTFVGVSYMKTLITRKRWVPGARNLDGRCSDRGPPVYSNLGPVRLTGWRQRVLACSIGLTLEMEKSKTAKNGPTPLGSRADCSATDGRSDMR